MKSCTTCGAEWSDDNKFCPNDGTTLRLAEGSDIIGSVIGGNYHIEKKLGEGGMGTVYLGTHVKMGRKSAIKVMAQSMASDTEAIARFNREATNAARINHPNVCAIYDFGETPDGTIFLAMEFIEGEALGDVLSSAGGRLPLDRASAILDQTADALQAAHDLGIVHRDLKPDNIMIAEIRGQEVVKVVDFGIAKAMGGEEGQKVTKTGLVIGTPEYMSPEQLSGDVLDGRSDIYSLALVFFRMITGSLPFPAESAQETMIKRLTDDPLRLEEAMPGGAFPPALQAVMDHALQRMPGDRFTHASELAAEVRKAVAGAPPATSGRPTVDSEEATQIIDTGEDDTVQLAATAVTPAQAGPLPKPPPRESTPATPAPASSPRPSTKKKIPVVPVAAAVLVIAAGGTTAAVMMGGGGEDGSAGPASVPAGTTIGNTPGGDSAGPPPPIAAAGSTRTDGTPNGGSGSIELPVTVDPDSGSGPVDTATVDPAATGSTLDSAAVDTDLGNILEEIEDAETRAAARRRAQDYFDNPDVPNGLRAQAALMVATAYGFEDRPDEECRWYRLAEQQQPGTLDDFLKNSLQRLGCSL